MKDGPSENTKYGRVAFPRGPATGRGLSIHNVDQIQGGGGGIEELDQIHKCLSNPGGQVEVTFQNKPQQSERERRKS